MYQNEAARAFHCYFLTFRRYAQFSGRATRSEFWYFTLFCLFIGIAFNILRISAAIADSTSKLNDAHTNFYLGAIFYLWLYILGIFIPSLAVQCRRLHDRNRSGWWSVLSFTLVGLIPLTIFLCQKSDPEANRFGEVPDPTMMGDLGKISALNEKHLEMIEKLADLKDRGILTEEEFIREKSFLLPGAR